jgi:group I intron endonuclease
MVRKWQIYKITNLINGKLYVGKQSHENPDYFGSGKLIIAAIKKYGKHNFEKTIIDETYGDKEGSELEIFWISELNSIQYGYNLELHGFGGIISNRQRRKIANTVSNLWKDPESVYNTREYRDKLSDAHKRPCLEETKRKIGIANKGEKNGTAAKFEIDGVIYNTRLDAAKAFGISDTMVAKRCNNPKFPTWVRLSPIIPKKKRNKI